MSHYLGKTTTITRKDHFETSLISSGIANFCPKNESSFSYQFGNKKILPSSNKRQFLVINLIIFIKKNESTRTKFL